MRTPPKGPKLRPPVLSPRRLSAFLLRRGGARRPARAAMAADPYYLVREEIQESVRPAGTFTLTARSREPPATGHQAAGGARALGPVIAGQRQPRVGGAGLGAFKAFARAALAAAAHAAHRALRAR